MLSSDRLYATYFGGDAKLGLSADEEAKQIWQVLLESSLLLFQQAGLLCSCCCSADVALLPVLFMWTRWSCTVTTRRLCCMPTFFSPCATRALAAPKL